MQQPEGSITVIHRSGALKGSWKFQCRSDCGSNCKSDCRSDCFVIVREVWASNALIIEHFAPMVVLLGNRRRGKCIESFNSKQVHRSKGIEVHHQIERLQMVSNDKCNHRLCLLKWKIRLIWNIKFISLIHVNSASAAALSPTMAILCFNQTVGTL